MSSSQHSTLRRAVRFTCTGLGVTALHTGIALLFLRFILPQPALANGIAFLTATAVSYWINTHWSFKSTLSGTTLGRFTAVSILGLCVAMLVAQLAESGGLPHWQGILLVALCVPPLSFLLHHFWTYK